MLDINEQTPNTLITETDPPNEYGLFLAIFGLVFVITGIVMLIDTTHVSVLNFVREKNGYIHGYIKNSFLGFSHAEEVHGLVKAKLDSNYRGFNNYHIDLLVDSSESIRFGTFSENRLSKIRVINRINTFINSRSRNFVVKIFPHWFDFIFSTLFSSVFVITGLLVGFILPNLFITTIFDKESKTVQIKWQILLINLSWRFPLNQIQDLIINEKVQTTNWLIKIQTTFYYRVCLVLSKGIKIPISRYSSDSINRQVDSIKQFLGMYGRPGSN